LHSLYCWWKGLSGESRAAIIAAIVGPVTVEILGIRGKMMRSFYINTIEKLETAEKQLQANHELRWRAGTNYDNSIFSLEQLAAKAKISMFRAKLAAKWNERVKKYGAL
jgi:hypothetical protein